MIDIAANSWFKQLQNVQKKPTWHLHHSIKCFSRRTTTTYNITHCGEKFVQQSANINALCTTHSPEQRKLFQSIGRMRQSPVLN